MNTIQLECFLAVAGASEFFQSFSGTEADAAGCQPSDPDAGGGAGGELFIRTSRNVELTQEGILLCRMPT